MCCEPDIIFPCASTPMFIVNSEAPPEENNCIWETSWPSQECSCMREVGQIKHIAQPCHGLIQTSSDMITRQLFSAWTAKILAEETKRVPQSPDVFPHVPTHSICACTWMHIWLARLECAWSAPALQLAVLFVL